MTPDPVATREYYGLGSFKDEAVSSALGSLFLGGPPGRLDQEPPLDEQVCGCVRACCVCCVCGCVRACCVCCVRVCVHARICLHTNSCICCSTRMYARLCLGLCTDGFVHLWVYCVLQE